MSARSRAVLQRLGYDQPDEPEDRTEANDAEDDEGDPDVEIYSEDRELEGGMTPRGDGDGGSPRMLARKYGRRRR